MCTKAGAAMALRKVAPSAASSCGQQWSAVQVEVLVNGVRIALGEVAATEQHARMLAAYAALAALKDQPNLLCRLDHDANQGGSGMLSLFA